MSFYADFSQVYDQIMDQSLYDEWLDFSLRYFPQNTKTVLELACGSGALAVKFAQAGFEVTGLDISEKMLTLARKKLPTAEFITADMRKFRLAKKFDAVTCYSDSLCYLSSMAELRQVFEKIHDLLNDKGVFIFDVHSTHQVDKVFPNYSYHENEEDFAFLWDSYAGNQPHSIEHQLSFFIKGRDEKFIRKDELHIERTYEIAEFLENLRIFSDVKVLADFTDDAPVVDSARWFFVCKK